MKKDNFSIVECTKYTEHPKTYRFKDQIYCSYCGGVRKEGENGKF